MDIGDMGVPFIYQGEELIYPEYVKDGLVLHYDFSGMTNEDVTKDIARDLSGNGNHGTLQNFNFTPESGYDKNKLLFDGVDDKLQIPELSLVKTGMTVGIDGKVYAYEDDKVLTVGDNGEVIGSGRNLILDSEKITIQEISGSSISYLDKHLGMSNVIKIDNPQRAHYINTAESYSEELEFDRDYTFSILFAYEGAVGSRLQGYMGAWSGYTNFEGDIKEGEFRQIYFTAKSREDIPDRRIHFDLTGFERVYITGLKIEKGGNPNPVYSPAPEDYKTTSLSPTSLSNLQLYNRPLTPSEIAHNYAIEKERFGIE